MPETRIKVEMDSFTLQITMAQSRFLDRLVASGKIAANRNLVIQHYLAREMDRLESQNRMPPDVIVITGQGEGTE